MLLGLIGCNGNQLAEQVFSPDPELQTPTPSIPRETPQLVLPGAFPSTIPVYPEAQLKAIAPNLDATQGRVTWESTDPVNLIQNYYQSQLTSANWNVTTDESDYSLTATKDDLELELSLNPSTSLTEIVVAYQSVEEEQQQPQTTQPSNNNNTISDIDAIPPQHQEYIQDLANLGLFSDLKDGFKPNQVITRREYARWLLTAHNLLYSDSPGQQINRVSQATQTAFEDITPDDPDFPIIQGLAEAGIIPSPLTGDTNASQFRPEDPLTRADLIAWKVPLDYRRALPPASIEDIRETWGFQDVNLIDPEARQALYIDEQNGSRANVRRAFGYTTLFQPDKTVTRSEAAAVLWYFGYQNQGISAAELNSQ